jgi:hypothetical protein
VIGEVPSSKSEEIAAHEDDFEGVEKRKELLVK